MTHVFILLMLIVLELIYLRVAKKMRIFDIPNERSSHKKAVVRGGGIIFLFAVWIFAGIGSTNYPLFFLGFSLVAITAFIDDVRSLSARIRFMVQFIAMLLLVMEADLLNNHIYWFIFPCTILGMCIINAYNFMDGINGITGAYSCTTLIALWLLNRKMAFIDAGLIEVLFLGALVFCFFNFRNKATCFAGDVGSVGMAYGIIFIMLRLILFTKDLTNLIFLVIYGIDVVLTISHRIFLHENILRAHRRHLFQLLVNEGGFSHVTVASSYVLLQTLISIGYIYLPVNKWAYSIMVIIMLIITYLLIARKLYPKHKLYLQQLELRKNEATVVK